MGRLETEVMKTKRPHAGQLYGATIGAAGGIIDLKTFGDPCKPDLHLAFEFNRILGVVRDKLAQRLPPRCGLSTA